MPLHLKQNDPALWRERIQFIERLKCRIGYCELTGDINNLSVHEFLAEYGKKNRSAVNRLFMLHPGNAIVLNNVLHVNQKPTVESCVVALYRRRADVCRVLGFPNGRTMVTDFCRKVVKLQQDGLIKILPPHVLMLSELK